MNIKRAFLIFKIETLKIFRQKNVFLTLFVYPFLYIPVLISIGFTASYFVKKEIDKENLYQLAWLGEKSEKIYNNLENEKIIAIKTIEHNELSKYAQDFILSSKSKEKSKDYKKFELRGREAYQRISSILNKRKIDVLIHSELDNENHVALTIFKTKLTQDLRKGKMINKIIKKITNEEFKRLRKERLDKVGMKESELWPLYVQFASAPKIGGITIESDEDKEFNFAVLFIPYIIAIIMISLIYHPIVHIVAEEKELRTIENMLVSPVDVLELIIGKMTAILLFLMVGLIPYAIQYVSFSFFATNFEGLQKIADYFIPLGISGVLGPLFVIVSFGVLSCSLIFLLCSFSSSKQQAQQMYGYCVMVLMGGIFATPIFGTDITMAKMYIPLINFSIYMGNIFGDDISVLHTLINVGTNLSFSLLLIFFAREFYDKQYYRLDSRYGINDLLTFKKLNIKKPVAPLGFMVFVCLMIAVFYGAFSLKSSVNNMLILNLLVAGGLIPLYLLRKYGISFKEVFPLTKVRWDVIFYSIIIGVSFPFFNMSLISLIPGIEELAKQLPQMNLNKFPLTYQLYLFCLLPAIFEEFCFRGIIFHSFRERYGLKFSIILSALFFSLCHGDALRFIPTFLIGLVLGAMVYRYRSMIYVILIHFLNNATAIVLANLSSPSYQQTKESSDVLWPLFVSAFLILFVLWLLFRSHKKEALTY